MKKTLVAIVFLLMFSTPFLIAQTSTPSNTIMVATTMEYDTGKGLSGVAKFQISGPLADTLRKEAEGTAKMYFMTFVMDRFDSWMVTELQIKNKNEYGASLNFAAKMENTSLAYYNGPLAIVPAALNYQPYLFSLDSLPNIVNTELLLFQTKFTGELSKMGIPNRINQTENDGSCLFTFNPSPGGNTMRSMIKMGFNPENENCMEQLKTHYSGVEAAVFKLKMGSRDQ